MNSNIYIFNKFQSEWNKIETKGIVPQGRAAHAAVEAESMQMVVFGGQIGSGNLASDDLYLLDLKQGEDKGHWILIEVTGPTPGRRFGHSMSYYKPCIIVFGGQVENSPANDVWILSIDSMPFKWNKLNFDTECPPPRYYHSASVCPNSANGLIVIVGGRNNSEEAIGDVWHLRINQEKKWEWYKLPMPVNSKTHTGRYQLAFGNICGTKINYIWRPREEHCS